MNVPILLLVIAVGLLVLLLGWAARPPRRTFRSPGEVLEALTQERHYARLPQILQALRKEDTEYLRNVGQLRLVSRVRSERTRIALRYLNDLEQEFQVLLEASRMLASMAPELSTMREFDRLKLSVRFVFWCRYLCWKLRLGLQPWNIFAIISDMAGEMTLRLEAATGRLGERAMNAYDIPSLAEKQHGDSG
jgi:hypothetical protein